jgi:hypothetical protein
VRIVIDVEDGRSTNVRIEGVSGITQDQAKVLWHLAAVVDRHRAALMGQKVDQ